MTILFIYLCYRGVRWFTDQGEVKDQLDNIYSSINIQEIDNIEDLEIISPEKVESPSFNNHNPYRDYTKINLIDVDLTELKKINDSTRGWIQVGGTNINYPFVQGGDNSFYLRHSFNKSSNQAGWVFMDYRNNLGDLDKNTIIYAHSMKDKTMFGSLKNILTNGWLSNPDNYIVKTSTDTENSLWQVFSIYHIPTTTDYLKINFSNEKEFMNFAQMLLDRSTHNFNTGINKEDKILTLSTCYNSTEKVVLHAKLIKIEKK